MIEEKQCPINHKILRYWKEKSPFIINHMPCPVICGQNIRKDQVYIGYLRAGCILNRRNPRNISKYMCKFFCNRKRYCLTAVSDILPDLVQDVKDFFQISCCRCLLNLCLQRFSMQVFKFCIKLSLFLRMEHTMVKF